MKKARMQSIWEVIIPEQFGYCDTDITDVLYPKENGGTFELILAIFPYDDDDSPRGKIVRKIVANDAFVFDPPSKKLVRGQALKRAYIYPEIVRLDLITTGSLLRIECNDYNVTDIVADETKNN